MRYAERAIYAKNAVKTHLIRQNFYLYGGKFPMAKKY
jgi:hypothetical protein